jgi:hypothetical protein
LIAHPPPIAHPTPPDFGVDPAATVAPGWSRDEEVVEILVGRVAPQSISKGIFGGVELGKVDRMSIETMYEKIDVSLYSAAKLGRLDRSTIGR